MSLTSLEASVAQSMYDGAACRHWAATLTVSAKSLAVGYAKQELQMKRIR
jgi:hypothetical protein